MSSSNDEKERLCRRERRHEDTAMRSSIDFEQTT
jgi:hypothetical protein